MIEHPDDVQFRAEELQAMADHCRWLARDQTDRRTVKRLLEMAREYEDRAAAIRRRTE